MMTDNGAPLPAIGKFYRDLDQAWRAFLRCPDSPTLLEVLAAHADRLRAFADEARIEDLQSRVDPLAVLFHALALCGKRPTSKHLQAIRRFMSDLLDSLQSSPTVALNRSSD